MLAGQNDGTWLQLALHQVAIAALPAHAPVAEHDFPPEDDGVVAVVEGRSDGVDVSDVFIVGSVLVLTGGKDE